MGWWNDGQIVYLEKELAGLKARIAAMEKVFDRLKDVSGWWMEEYFEGKKKIAEIEYELIKRKKI